MLTLQLARRSVYVAARIWPYVTPTFLRNPAMQIELRHHRRAGVETDTIDLQVLHHALDVVACFGERNAFHPIDRIHLGIARIAVLLDPLLDTATAGIVAGEGHDVRAAILA